MRKPIHKFEKFTDLRDMLKQSEEKFGDRAAYVYKNWQARSFLEKFTYKDFAKDIRNFGTALVNLGLKDKRIAVISDNRYEWCVTYLAVTTGTGVIVPLDKALPANEIESLIIRSEVEAIVYSSKYDEIMNDIKARNTSNAKYFISMDLSKKRKWYLFAKRVNGTGSKTSRRR